MDKRARQPPTSGLKKQTQEKKRAERQRGNGQRLFEVCWAAAGIVKIPVESDHPYASNAMVVI